ncbi:MAG TPA: hypothetical protein VEI25_02360 [Paraburkholderia sp.]|nr:hypothetical protein [Paraburkholderia sp.]
MSTIPLTLIEGRISLPRPRPFDHLPAGFGREWSLLPPNFSFRPELKALYAALLRTFCLSSAAMLSMCRWEPPRAKAHAGPSAHAAAAAPATKTSRLDIEAILMSTTPSRSTRNRALAGCAFATGGVALLAWTLLRHAPFVEQQNIASLVDPAPFATQPARAPLQPDAATLASASADIDAHASAEKVVPVGAGIVDGSMHRDTGKATVHARGKNDRAEARYVDVDLRRRTASRPVKTARTTTIKHSSAQPSARGRYSPHPVTRAVTDDYASLVTWARAQENDFAHARNTFPTNDSGWMDHMQHRRITEVPGRFVQ